jgi:hypothetical protein
MQLTATTSSRLFGTLRNLGGQTFTSMQMAHAPQLNLEAAASMPFSVPMLLLLLC